MFTILEQFMEKRSVFHRVGLTVARNFLTVTVPLAVVIFIYNDRRKSIDYRARKTAEIRAILAAEGSTLECNV